MEANLIRLAVLLAPLLVVQPAVVFAQGTAALPLVQTAVPSAPEQLDQMLAPVALFPDPLLMQILMAATYPVDVVEADRWLRNPANAALKGDQLTAALDPQSWDPSVKSLILFPNVLHMMDGNLAWTERLGNIFVSDQSSVMDSVQRLRQRAQLAGQLTSTPRQDVETEDGTITIQPTNPEFVYVPIYDPSTAYGGWPYPTFPPFYFPDSYDTEVMGDAGWFGVDIVTGLWGWDRWDWAGHRIVLDRQRWTSLSHRPMLGLNDTWTHDPSRRAGIALAAPAGREQLGNAVGPLVTRGGFRDGLPAPATGFRPSMQAASPRIITPDFEARDRRVVVGRAFAQQSPPRGAVPVSQPRRRDPGFEGRGGGFGRR